MKRVEKTSLKIVSYNIWNTVKDFDKRLKLLSKVIKDSSPDVVALQEVRDSDLVEKIKLECGFKYSIFVQYPDENEGLAIISNYQISNHHTNWEDGKLLGNNGMLRAIIDFYYLSIGVTNLHLDWEKVSNREEGIVDVLSRIESSSDYEFLLGDFNSYPSSSVYRFLTGDQSLNNISTHWLDLPLLDCLRRGVEVPVTLDFDNNPRWDNESSLEISGRFDWILLRYPYPKKSPKLIRSEILGDKRVDNITPSDHYGVIVELDFEGCINGRD